MGLPRVQQNERPTLYLLALLNHTPGTVWVDVQNPLVGVTPIRVWAREHYDKKYAPNTRETTLRQTRSPFAKALQERHGAGILTLVGGSRSGPIGPRTCPSGG